MNDYKVLNHLCEGLERFQKGVDNKEQGKDFCVPTIEDDGTVYGCDNSNETKITHCPFCGIRLIWITTN